LCFPHSSTFALFPRSFQALPTAGPPACRRRGPRSRDPAPRCRAHQGRLSTLVVFPRRPDAGRRCPDRNGRATARHCLASAAAVRPVPRDPVSHTSRRPALRAAVAGHRRVGPSVLAQAVWTRLRFMVHESILRRPWDVTLPSSLLGAVKDDVMILIHIWKALNAKIFDHRNSSPTEILRHIAADIDAWSCRYRRLAAELHAWQEWIVTC